MFRNEKLSIEEGVKALIGELTIEEKFGLLSSVQQPIERLEIKERHKHMLECYDTELEEFVFEMGEYSFSVGASSDDIRSTIASVL